MTYLSKALGAVGVTLGCVFAGVVGTIGAESAIKYVTTGEQSWTSPVSDLPDAARTGSLAILGAGAALGAGYFIGARKPKL